MHLRPTLVAAIVILILVAGCHRSKNVKIHGQVVDDVTGTPIANADICLRTCFHTISRPLEDAYTTSTDAQGRFRIAKIRVRDDLATIFKTSLDICAMKDGYDWTYANFDYFSDFRTALEIRLEKDRCQPLPAGWLALGGQSHRGITDSDEPVFRLLFVDERLRIADAGQNADFELRFKFVPVDEGTSDNVLWTVFPSKSGKGQFLESVAAPPNRIAQLVSVRKNGEPPRLPALETVVLEEACSFHQPYDEHFLSSNEFLLQTRDGKYALLHFNADSVKWVYQPDGTRDISRRRKNRDYHCENCRQCIVEGR